ncbi:MAG: SprT family zinc-dependent metalloprotease [Anaerocolumna sp.]
MIENITIGDRTITYEIIRKKVKNINLHVKSDGRIIISANSRVSPKYIEEFILRKADWIEKSLKRFENRDMDYNKDFKLSEGECIKLLGIEYPIYILASLVNHIEINNTGISIYNRFPEDKVRIKAMWEKWYGAFIKEVFYQSVKEIHLKFLPYHVAMPVIKIRKMKTRWGSCSVYSGMITLNTALIHAPIECIEYVAAHELTHFLQPNHSSKFYNMLGIIMPDHKERKKLLENQPIYY